MVKDVNYQKIFQSSSLSILFLVARFIMVLSIPLEGLKSYGDFWNYYHLAGLGRPFLDFWVEFPPLFPALSRGLYLMVGGREHSFIYALIALFSIIQSANIFLFQKIASSIHPQGEAQNRSLIYAFSIVGLFYGWAYFDSLTVFCMLLGLSLLLKKGNWAAGLALGIGGTIKWFPLLVLPAAWKWLGGKKAIQVIVIAVVIVVLAWGILFGLSPDFAKSSLISQGAKGSWETVWALIDGNLSTGNFSPQINRMNPASAFISSGNSAVVPAWMSLLVIGGIGFALFWKSSVKSPLELAAFSALTLVLFFLWSPGYSPQWILYLLPLVMLCFERGRSLLLALVLLLINLLEWPILLSRGWFQFLEEIILLRTGIFILLAILFARVVFNKENNDKVKIDSIQKA